jgi:hypothetical protein
MSEIYTFYIDKAKNNKNSNHIDVIIPYPIIANNKEKLSIKMIDFKYLNNIFNISSALQNNTITLQKTPTVYTGYITGQTFIEFFAFFKEDLFSLKDDIITNYITSQGIQTIENDSYIITYKDPNIIAGTNAIKNIFKTYDFDRGIDNFTFPENEFIFQSKTEKDYLFTGFNYAITHNGAVINGNQSFDLKTYGSDNGVDYVLIEKFGGLYDFTFFFSEATNIDNTLNMNGNYRPYKNFKSYKYYKINITNNDIENLSNYKLTNISFQTYTYEYFLNPEPQKRTITTLTIPEGFYKSSTFMKTINDILEPHDLVVTLNTLNNKLSILNNNVFDTSNQNNYKPITTADNTSIISFPTSINTAGNYKILFQNQNIKTTYGIDNDEILLEQDIFYLADNNINLTNFSKLIITTSLNFHNITHNEIVQGSDNATGIGNILTCIDNDEVPFSYIKYTNHEMIQQKLGNKSISNIRFSFYNERSNEIYLSDAFIHFQIIKSKK